MNFVESEEVYLNLLEDIFVQTQVNKSIGDKAARDNFKSISSVMGLKSLTERLAIDCFMQDLSSSQVQTLRDAMFRNAYLDKAYFGPLVPEYGENS